MSKHDIRTAIKVAVAIAKRHGYRIDDEAYSDAGLCVVTALQKWQEGRGMSFNGYVALLLCQALMAKRDIGDEEFCDEETFIERASERPDYLQRFLCEEPEPWRSIGFAVWVDRCEIKYVADAYKVSVYKLNTELHKVAVRIRKKAADVAFDDGRFK